jgi:hypothetical protein
MDEANDPTYQINGRVADAKTGRGIPGLRVEAWDKDLFYDDLVGQAVTDGAGRFRIDFAESYYSEGFFEGNPELYFKLFSGGELLASTKDSVGWSPRAGSRPVEIAVPWQGEIKGGGEDGGGGAGSYGVAGRVTSPDRAGVGGLRVEIVDRNVGRDVTLAEAETDDRGRYDAAFSASALGQKAQPDLQARVYAGDTFVAASEVRFNAGASETLNVALPANSSALPSEHETLTKALASHFGGALGELKESGERQDITYLARKTGWDARAVALASLADRFSRQATRGGAGDAAIAPAFYYALFRAGLPANPDTLYRADPQAVAGVWRQAVEQGVLPKAAEGEIDRAVESFRRLGAESLLTAAPAAGVSNVREMLNAADLDEGQQRRFAELYTTHRQDAPKFWEEVSGALGRETADRLQLDGKLGFLTLNNAPLVRALRGAAREGGLGDTVELARSGYFRAEKWGELLGDGVPVPKEIPGASAEEKRRNYSEYLAAQVRLSYPTVAVAEMAGAGELAVERGAEVRDFLNEHQGRFEIGLGPVGQYIARNRLEVPAETVGQITRLQRAYQITPTDAAMAGLLRSGMDSAYSVARHERGDFVKKFSRELGGAEVAAQTYDRAVQVHNITLNIAISYLTARNGFDLGARQMDSDERGQLLRPGPDLVAPNAGDVIAYPTLEGLFGEMDYCACDHCRSILSPAAYLVDILHFIDRPPTEAGKQNPQSVLFERRPDVQHLPLTCENTNTALPYIDVVNETLEYFIANGTRALSLEDYAGHDTGDAESADLLASPQYVMDSAYQTLRGRRFPPPLPFHQPLENLRRYFARFEAPLPLAMERLRRTDALERGSNAYGWRDIWMEELRLSRAEYEILTDSAAVPLRSMYGFPAGTTVAAAVEELSNAKRFTRRLGLTYDELVSVLKTRFVNPNGELVPKLERLGVPFGALQALQEGTLTDAQFDALLPTGTLAPDPANYGGDIKAWVRDPQNFQRVMGIITLADPSPEPDPCSFDNLEFRFARPMDGVGDTSTRVGAVEFVRLLRFIRLWRKLGWTVEQTDAAVCALFPVPPFPAAAGAIDTVARLDEGFAALLPRLGIVARVMRELNLNVKRDLLPLLALWSPLGTHGEVSLYRQMFLSPAVLRRDAVFADNGYGEYLRDGTQKLVGHAEALRAAFGLTGEEFSQILAALGFDADTSAVAYTHPDPGLGQAILEAAPGVGYDGANNLLTFKGALTAGARDALKALPGVSAQFRAAVDALYAANQAALTGLTLDNLSAVFRRGWLARKLKISVRELLLLTGLTNLDPFSEPDPTAPALLKLTELIGALKGRALKSAAALYLIWDEDLGGKSAPDPAQVLEFARTLRGDFAAVEDLFAAVEDPGGDLARTRMALVYGSEPADAFFALLDNTVVLDAPYTHAQPTLEAAIRAEEAALGYDDFRHRLTHTGLLGAAKRDALRGLPGVSADFQAAVGALFALGEDARGSFFTRHPELEPLYTAYVTSPAPVEERRASLLAAFSPGLARLRKRQQALQRVSAAANTGLDFTRAVLDPPAAPFPLHAEGRPDLPALDDVVALDRAGLAAQFFFRDTATGAVDQSVAAAPSLDYAAGGENPLPANTAVPGAAVSGIWSGLVETPEAGFYNFVVEADLGATVTLSLGGQARPLTQNDRVWRNTQPLELAAGALQEIVITANRVRDRLAVRWETPKRGREVIPARYLYPSAVFAPFGAAYVRFFKAASLAQGLRLTAGEFAYLATHADYQIGGDNWPNLLPVAGAPPQPVAAALLGPLGALLDFARIKSELAPDDESLLAVLRDPAAATADAEAPLFKLTRWDRKSLDDLLAHFNRDVAGLSRPALFRRVYDAFALLTSTGVPAAALLQATTNEPTADTVRALQAALRARYEAEDWRTIVQPVNDEMRALQRDALVAYILDQMRAQPATAHIDTADKLFEYFLMDVLMEPCMQTSRIRHALSSVQLFVERCLMNLEPRVSPASVDGKQWEWMKRYRVWEANRKVFLFPENWLEPELRDNKSPFFKEVESELLQSDITDDTATAALLNYLAKLEEIAKLEPCGIYHVEADPALDRNELDHVIARTTGASRKYYYRRREGGNWTAWEQIKLDIEDNPVAPVVWRGRFLLFWLRVQKVTQTDPTKLKTSQNKTTKMTEATPAGLQADAAQNAKENARVSVKAVLCWSEYYNGKWQAVKTSDVDRPTEITWFTSQDDFDRADLRLTSHEEGERHLLRVSVEGDAYSTFLLYNTHGLPEREEDNSHVVGDMFIGPRYLDTHLPAFRIEYYIFEDSALGKAGTTHKRTLLTNPFRDRTVETQHPLKDIWSAPFFYEDPLHLFYVRTEHERVPFGLHPGYGVEYRPGAGVYEIPPLVFEREPRGPRLPWEGDGPPGPDDYRVVNPAGVLRFVTEDAHIQRGIAATGSVEFDGKRVGAKGAPTENSFKL